MGLPTLIFIPNCSPLLNIKDSIFPCSFHPNNAVGGYWLVHIPWKCHLECIPAGWQNGHSKSFSFLPLLIEHYLLLFPHAAAIPVPSSCFSFYPEDEVINIFIKLNLKLSPYFSDKCLFLFDKKNILDLGN